MSWRQASYLLRNILDCWQQTGELNSIKQYDRFEGDALDRIIEVLTEVENPYSKLEKHSIEAEKVAVIGLDRFKALEKKILHDEFDEIEVFSGEKKELSEFKVFESKTELVQSLKENIERLGPENTGILVHPESPYQPLIESVLR